MFDFTKGEVRHVTPEQARQEIEETCRNHGHYFTTIWPVEPHPSDHCVCGDITFKEWGKSGL